MMSINELTLLFFIAHFLADFYFQSGKMANQKDQVFGEVLKHSILYCLTMLALSRVLTLLGSHWHLILAGVVISALHLLIDALKFEINIKFEPILQPGSKPAAALYLADQLLHIAVIIAFIQYGYLGQYNFVLPGFVSRDLIKWALLVLLNAKPANISFKKLFQKYVPDGIEQEQISLFGPPARPPEPGAGALIGTIERFLCIIFISLGQFSAIGLVYTAKSIARFEKIGKDHRFAEYYLIGTLYSILYVLVCYGLIMRFVSY